MRIRLIAALVLTSCVLAGCATEAGYKKLLDGWVGADADQLVMQWGPPDSSYTMSDGVKVLQYRDDRQYHSGGYTTYNRVTTYNNGASSTTLVPTTTPLQTWNEHCTTRFQIGTDNKVKSYSYEGDDCVADEK